MDYPLPVPFRRSSLFQCLRSLLTEEICRNRVPLISSFSDETNLHLNLYTTFLKISWNDLTCGKEQETSETDIELRQRSSSICVFGIFDVNEQNAEINSKDSPKQYNFAEKYDTIYLDFTKVKYLIVG